MTDQDVIAAIRANHLQANIAECDPENCTLSWERAWVDSGGTIFGRGPYAHVPVTMNDGSDEWVIRVYPPEHLRKRLALLWRPTS